MHIEQKALKSTQPLFGHAGKDEYGCDEIAEEYGRRW